MKDKDKLQEAILKADMKSVEKIWKESDGEQTLAALLEKMTKDELVKVAKKYDVKGITSLKKAEVVERIREVIIKNVDLMINSLEETSIKFLQELINYGGVKKYQCDLLINSNFLRKTLRSRRKDTSRTSPRRFTNVTIMGVTIGGIYH